MKGYHNKHRKWLAMMVVILMLVQIIMPQVAWSAPKESKAKSVAMMVKEALEELEQEDAMTQKQLYGSVQGRTLVNYTNKTFENTSCYTNRFLGVANDFHLFASDTITLDAHCNGNYATPKVIANNASGTNQIKETGGDELSFFHEMERETSTILSNMIVVKEQTPLTKIVSGMNGEEYTYGQQLSNQVKFFGATLDMQTNQNICISGNDFIDFSKEFTTLRGISQKLSRTAATMTQANDENQEGTYNLSDQNHSYIHAAQNKVNIVNCDATDLASGAMYISGLTCNQKTGASHTYDGNTCLIVNVDCKGATEVKLGKQTASILCTCGESLKVSNGEQNYYLGSAILWNFYDSTQPDNLYTGSVVEEGVVNGSYLAPNASILTKTNANGTLIAKTIDIKAQSHRADFLGYPIGERPEVPDTPSEPEKQTGSIVITGDNVVKGEPEDIKVPDETFHYELKDETGKTIATTERENSGSISFPKIDYTEDDIGEHTYTVVEIKGDTENMTYDESEQKVVVKVEKGEDGTLHVTTDDKPEFINIYKEPDAPKTGSAQLKGSNTVKGEPEGTEVPDETFHYIVKEGDKEITTAQIDNSGNLIFGTIEYEEKDVGEHIYTVEQVEGTTEGMTYDTEKKTITVIVKDNPDNKEKLEVTVDKDADFVNIYRKPEEPEPAKKEGSIVLTIENVVKSEPEGLDIPDETFSYIVKEGDKEIGTAKIDNNGKISLDKINYTEDDIGTHTYTITEIKGTTEGMTYDSSEQVITVTVADKGGETLEVTADKNAEFVNIYRKPEEPQKEKTGSIVLTGTNVVKGEPEGIDVPDETFYYTVKDENGKVIATTDRENGGALTFTEITYTQDDIGTHKYTIEEKKGSIDGMTYDTTKHTVTVTVKDGDAASDKLEVTLDKKPEFVNIYKEPAKPSSTPTKPSTVSQPSTPTKPSTVSQPSTPTKPSTVSQPSTPTKPSTVSQPSPSTPTKPSAVSQPSPSTPTKPSTVSQPSTPTKPSAVSQPSTPTEKTGSIVLTGTNVVKGEPEGINVPDEIFVYTVKDENGKVIATTNRKNDGDLTFTKIYYTQDDIGTHKYYIEEKEGSIDGMTYDTVKRTVIVTVKDSNADSNQLEVTVDEKPEFVNIYREPGETSKPSAVSKPSTAPTKPSAVSQPSTPSKASTPSQPSIPKEKKGSIVLSGTNVVKGDPEGIDVPDETFYYTVKDEKGKVIATTDRKNGGSLNFIQIEYTQDDIGEHTYTVEETKGSIEGMTYDTVVRTIVVTVKDTDATSERLEVTLDNKPEFVNIYKKPEEKEKTGSIVIKGTNEVRGETPDTVVPDENFTYVVKEGDKVIATANRDGSGNLVFTEITYTKEDIGTHEYIIEEQKGDIDGMTYDTATRTILVTVKDNGGETLDVTIDEEPQFVNIYENPNADNDDNTGDDGNEPSNEPSQEPDDDDGDDTDDGDDDDGEEPDDDDANTATGIFSKQSSGGGAELPGATLELTYEDGDYDLSDVTQKSGPTVEKKKNKRLIRWVSTGDPVILGELPEGEYAWTEIGAPQGYRYAETIYFMVGDDGNIYLEKADGSGYESSPVANGRVVMKDEAKGATLTLTGTKRVEGNGAPQEAYSFSVREGENLMTTGRVYGAGTIAFATIAYGPQDIGTHTYQVAEIKGNTAGMQYDTSVKTLTVEVSDPGTTSDELKVTMQMSQGDSLTFTNKYDPATISQNAPNVTGQANGTAGASNPKTGDDSNLIYWILLLAAGTGVVVTVTYKRKKRF